MLCMLDRHVGLSRPFYVNKIYSFIHYALGLRFGKVYEQKCETNAIGSQFYPTNSVISYRFSCVGYFSRVFPCIFDTNMLISKT